MSQAVITESKPELNTMIFPLRIDSSPEARGNLGLFILSSSTSTIWFNPVIKMLQSRQANRVGKKSAAKVLILLVRIGMKPTIAVLYAGNWGFIDSNPGTRVNADSEMVFDSIWIESLLKALGKQA